MIRFGSRARRPRLLFTIGTIVGSLLVPVVVVDDTDDDDDEDDDEDEDETEPADNGGVTLSQVEVLLN